MIAYEIIGGLVVLALILVGVNTVLYLWNSPLAWAVVLSAVIALMVVYLPPYL